jgi:hypothetical protein
MEYLFIYWDKWDYFHRKKIKHVLNLLKFLYESFKNKFID